MTVFAAAVDSLFEDDNIATAATYFPVGGRAQIPVRVVSRRGDVVTDFGGARVVSETTIVDLRVSEVEWPQRGDRLDIAGEVFEVQSDPIRDREHLVWTLELRPV